MKITFKEHGWKLVLLAIFLLVPSILGREKSYVLYILNIIAIWSMVSIALNLLVGFGGQISVGQASFFAIGAYSSALLAKKLGLSFWLAFPLAGLVTAVAGCIIGLPAVRLKGHFLAVATLGFGVAIPQLALKLDALTGGANGLTVPAPAIGSFAFKDDKDFYFLSLAGLLMTLILISNLLRSRQGRAFVAIKESEVAAQAMGINVAGYKTMLFSISAFFTGLAGSLYAHHVNYISPYDFSLDLSFLALAMVVVGGAGSIVGSVLGAAILIWVPQLTSGIHGLSHVLTGVVLMAIVLFFPNGLSGLLRVLMSFRKDQAWTFYQNVKSRLTGGSR